MDKSYLEAIESNNFDHLTLERIIEEAPRTRFIGVLPARFEFLMGSFVDLGFRNLGLGQVESFALAKALLGTGVCVPGTPFKLRTERTFFTRVELADGSEVAVLPLKWKQAVRVLGYNGSLVWFGKLYYDSTNQFVDSGDGWALKSVNG